MVASSSTAERVVILGGGIAALTAAWELAKLRNADGSRRYCITVYQQGWRLGGKGASGRNAECYDRIEEHGLHVWFGAYENAFRTMCEVYSQQSARWPYNDLRAAFRPQYGFQLMEDLPEGWNPWPFSLPPTPGEPGDGAAPANSSPRELANRVAFWLADYFEGHMYAFVTSQTMRTLARADVQPPTDRLTPEFLRELARLGASEHDAEERERIIAGYSEFRTQLWGLYIALERPVLHESPGLLWDKDTLRRAGIVMEVAMAVQCGYWGDVFPGGWDRINHHDLRDWLCKWITKGNEALCRSELVTASYDLFFSYMLGNTRQDRIEAGTAIRAAKWLLLQYKGAFMWRMNSAMGDTIFAPLYNALVQEDVKFRFFHKVVRLGLSSDRSRVEIVTLLPQASVKDGGDYQPFVRDRLGRECWPDRPDFGQLNEGDELRLRWTDCHLESDWSEWKSPHTELKLLAGQHFEKIVLADPDRSARRHLRRAQAGPGQSRIPRDARQCPDRADAGIAALAAQGPRRAERGDARRAADPDDLRQSARHLRRHVASRSLREVA